MYQEDSWGLGGGLGFVYDRGAFLSWSVRAMLIISSNRPIRTMQEVKKYITKQGGVRRLHVTHRQATVASRDDAVTSPAAASTIGSALKSPKTASQQHQTFRVRRKYLYVFFIASQFALLIVLLAIVFVAPPARNHLATQKSELLNGQAQMLKALSSMPSPTEMQPGIQNSQSRYVVNETARQTDLLAEAMPTLQLSRNTRLLHYITPGSPLASANKNFSDIESIANEAQKQSQNYTQLLQATIQFIEYNPRIDTKTYLEDAADTAERMGRLEQGLTNTAQAIDTIALNESVKKDVLTIIKNAEITQKRLLSDNDVERFVADMDSLQLELINYLSDYLKTWQTQSSSELIRMVRLIQL